jgi:hypothetical protein
LTGLEVNAEGEGTVVTVYEVFTVRVLVPFDLLAAVAAL